MASFTAVSRPPTSSTRSRSSRAHAGAAINNAPHSLSSFRLATRPMQSRGPPSVATSIHSSSTGTVASQAGRRGDGVVGLAPCDHRSVKGIRRKEERQEVRQAGAPASADTGTGGHVADVAEHRQNVLQDALGDGVHARAGTSAHSIRRRSPKQSNKLPRW
jgi:hypothetical protein